MSITMRVYLYPLALALATFALCMSVHATPFSGFQVDPIDHNNWAVQIPSNRSNLTGISLAQLTRQFPQANFTFANEDGRALVGYLGSIWAPSQQVVWTTPLVDVQPDPEPVALAYTLPVYAPIHEPFHPHEPLVGVPEPATWLLVLLGIGLVWVAVALTRRK